MRSVNTDRRVNLTCEHVRLAQEKSPASLGKHDQKERAVPGVVAHEEKIYAFDGRNRFDDEIIRGGLHSRRGIFSVFPVLTLWSWT